MPVRLHPMQLCIIAPFRCIPEFSVRWCFTLCFRYRLHCHLRYNGSRFVLSSCNSFLLIPVTRYRRSWQMISDASRAVKQNLRSFRLLQPPDSLLQKTNWLRQDAAVCRNAHPSACCRTLRYFQMPTTLILIVVHFCPVCCTTAQRIQNLKIKKKEKKF